MPRDRFHKGDGRPRYVGPSTVVFPDGSEAAVEASLVLCLDPPTVPDFSCDRHNTCPGSIALLEGSEDDLFDAAPGVLRLPDGREGKFMATSGPNESGCSGLGPTRSAEAHPLTTVWAATRRHGIDHEPTECLRIESEQK